MRFVETPVFTRQIRELLSDDDYRRLQVALVLRPDQGAVIKGTSGLRKVRWPASGQGKRGGLRIIYYWMSADEWFYMLYAYPKNERADLTAAQRKLLRQAVKEELG